MESLPDGDFTPYQELEKLAEYFCEELPQALNDVLEKYGSFVAAKNESPYVNLRDITDHVALVACGGIKDVAAEAVAYRAMHFALQVQQAIAPFPPRLKIPENYYDDPTQELDMLGAKYMGDSGDYYASRPTLAMLLEDYKTEIDPDGDYPDVAEIVSGLAFMHLDAHGWELYEQSTETEMKNWAAEVESLKYVPDSWV
ncbi:MAG: hypothetical protein WC498_01100 [Candidatus Saccharimonadales bacterium]